MFGEEDIVSKKHLFITLGGRYGWGLISKVTFCAFLPESPSYFGHLLKKHVQWGCRKVGEIEKFV